MTDCRGCGRSIRPTFRFCPACGAGQDERPWIHPLPVAPARSATERKFLTVLVADLCSSTRRVAQIDPEDAQALLEDILRRFIAAVHERQGTVCQLLGDGLVALFGAPIAQEDHAHRACRAALAILQSATEDSSIVRVAVASGEVVVGTIGFGNSGTYRADGAAIHLAARIEQIAAPGSIVISDETRRLLAEHVDVITRPHPPLQLADRQVALFELIDLQRRHPLRSIASAQRPLIGRQEELARLRADYDLARSEGMRIIGLRAEAGMGKSRLLAEFWSSIVRTGEQTCWITAGLHADQMPYAMAVDLIAQLLDPQIGEGVANRLDSLIEIMSHWPRDSDVHRAAIQDLLGIPVRTESWLHMTPRERQGQITSTVHWLMQRRTAAGPLLIVLDDLHHADRHSIRLLDSLATRIEALPILFCVAYRPDFEQRSAGLRCTSEIRLDRLSDASMGQIARSLPGHQASRVRSLISRAGGNPFFLEQLVAGAEAAPGPSVGSHSVPRVPGSIAAIIAPRLDRLPPLAKSVLEAAAVMADPITPSMAARILGITDAESAQALKTCERAGLMILLSGHAALSWCFTHGLTREVVLATLTASRRRALHHAAYTALVMADTGAPADHPAVLAWHAAQGGAWREAGEHSLQAMTRSVGRSANRDALRLFNLGLIAIANLPDGIDRCQIELELRLKACSAQLPLGRIDEIEENLREAAALAARLHDPSRQAQALSQMALAQWMVGRYRDGLHSTRLAADLHTDRAASLINAKLALMMRHGQGDFVGLIRDARQLETDFAAELADQTPTANWPVIASIHIMTLLIDGLLAIGATDQAQRTCDRARKVLQARAHVYSQTMVEAAQARILMAREQPAQAIERLNLTLTICRERGLSARIPPLTAMLGGALAMAGQAGQAMALLNDAMTRRLDRIGPSANRVSFPLNLALACAMLHRYDTAMTHAKIACDNARRHEQRAHEAQALALMATLARESGASAQAAICRAQSLELARTCGMILVCPLQTHLESTTLLMPTLTRMGEPTVASPSMVRGLP